MQSLQTYFRQKSLDFVRTKTTLEEYTMPVVFLLMISIVTSYISVYASFGFMQGFSKTFAEGTKGIIAALAVAILIEVLTIYFISALTKSITRRIIGQIVFWAVFAGGIYFINFYTSTDGLKQRAETKTDKTEAIAGTFSRDSVRIAAKYNTLIDSLMHANGTLAQKNTEFNHSQIKYNQRMIEYSNSKLDNELMKLRHSVESNFAKNDTKVQQAGGNNYNYMVINQLVQIITHILLSIFYFVVGKENQTVEDKIQEQIMPIKAQIKQQIADATIKETVSFVATLTNEILKDRDIASPTVQQNQTANVPNKQVVTPQQQSAPAAQQQPAAGEKKKIILTTKPRN